MTTSLRKKIILPVAGLLTTAGLVATISAYQLVKWETNKFLDDQLEQIARNVGPGIVGISAPQPEIEIEDRLVVQILDRAGRLVYRSGPQIALVRQPLNAFPTSVSAGRIGAFTSEATASMMSGGSALERPSGNRQSRGPWRHFTRHGGHSPGMASDRVVD